MSRFCGYIWIVLKYRPFCPLIGFFQWKQGSFYACGILPNTRFYKSVHIYNLITNAQHWIGKTPGNGINKKLEVHTLQSTMEYIAGCCHLTAMFNCFFVNIFKYCRFLCLIKIQHTGVRSIDFQSWRRNIM